MPLGVTRAYPVACQSGNACHSGLTAFRVSKGSEVRLSQPNQGTPPNTGLLGSRRRTGGLWSGRPWHNRPVFGGCRLIWPARGAFCAKMAHWDWLRPPACVRLSFPGRKGRLPSGAQPDKSVRSKPEPLPKGQCPGAWAGPCQSTGASQPRHSCQQAAARSRAAPNRH